MIRDISVRPTKITGPVKVDHLRRWSQICWSDQTKMVCSIFISNRNSGSFGLNGKRPVYNNEVTIKQGMTVMSFQHRTPILHTFQPHANFKDDILGAFLSLSSAPMSSTLIHLCFNTTISIHSLNCIQLIMSQKNGKWHLCSYFQHNVLVHNIVVFFCFQHTAC